MLGIFAAQGTIEIWYPLKDPLLVEFWYAVDSDSIDEVANSVSEWRGLKNATPVVNSTAINQPQTNVR